MSDPIATFGRQWLLDRVNDVASNGYAYLLVQGYPATGFGVIRNEAFDLRLEPDIKGDVALEWNYYFDVRMFGDRGEWHCWRVPSTGWQGRLARLADWIDTPLEREYIERDYVLWGTPAERDGEWWVCKEGRGAKVWIPVSATVSSKKPAALRIRHRIEFDGNGLAGIVDAMVLKFVS